MIGEAQNTLGKAAKAEENKKPHEEEPGEELEKLEQENEERVEALQGKSRYPSLDFMPRLTVMQVTRPCSKISGYMRRNIVLYPQRGVASCLIVLKNSEPII